MLIFDGHLDLALNAIRYERDLTVSVAETRHYEQSLGQTGGGRGWSVVSFPELRQGRVGLFIATVLARIRRPGNPRSGHATPEAAYAAAQGELAYYRILEERGVLQWIRGTADLDAAVASWSDGAGEAPFGMVLTMEGADPILYPEQVHAWKDQGLRCLSLSHYGVSTYAHGTATVGGLTDLGFAILPEIRKAGLVLDLTHLADQAFWECIERFDGPIQCSHQNCRGLVPGDRQMDDDQLRAVISRGGVIGAALDAWMLQPGWVIGGTTNENCSLQNVADHIDHVCQLAGNSRHAAIGSDLDGGFGWEQCPHDLQTIADLQKLLQILRSRGYSDADVQAIAHGNLVRLFRDSWSDS